MKVLERIYQSYNTESKEDCPFETGEMDGLFGNFLKTYIRKKERHPEEQETMLDDFVTVLLCERETAFKVGFKACMELMLDVKER